MESTVKKKLKLGVISASEMAKRHMNGIRENKNAELAAICDIDEEKAARTAAEFGIARYYADYREMLEQDDIDAVVVVTPDQVHAEQTIAALEKGKHVLCEKPMALTLEECRRMVEASDRTGKKLMVGQLGRYTPGFRATKKLIDDGEIGELFFVESEYAHDYSNIPGVGNWRIDKEKLRHPIIGGGCHAIDLLRWIAGDPYEITAYANKKVLKTWPVDDTTIAIMKFPKEVLGKVFVSVGCKRAYTMRSVFYGDKGTIVADNISPYITVYKETIAEGHTVLGSHHDQAVGLILPVDVNNHNTAFEIDEFVDCIVNDKKILIDGRQGASTVAVCVAAVKSVEKGEKVHISYDF